MGATSRDRRTKFSTRLAGMAWSLTIATTAATVLPALTVTQAQAQSNSTIIKGRDGWLFPGWGSLTQLDRSGIDKSTKLIAQARALLAAKNIQLDILVIPDKARLYSEKLPDGTRMSPDVQGRYALIMEQLKKAGVPTFDDNATLQALRKADKDVFYRADQHWTQDAVDATADATAAMILQSTPNLAGTKGTGMALGPLFKERRYGDLAELFLTPDERKALGRDVYTVRRQPESTQLLDEVPAPVHVVGHSMVQPYFGFPQKLSNVLDRPVSLNWKPGNVGPWIMLLEYLESPEFRQHKPQVIVWQMFEPTFSYGPDAQGWWDSASLMPPDTWLQRVKAALGG